MYEDNMLELLELYMVEKKDEIICRLGKIVVIRGVNAAIALGEATARAVQRIPGAHCNDDMHSAVENKLHNI